MKILGQNGLNFIANKYKELRSALSNKVDKVSGKDLSTNDFTNTYKSKLDNIDLSKYAEKSYLDSASKNLVNGISIFPVIQDGEVIYFQVAITNEEADIIDFDFLRPASQKQMGLMSGRDKKKLDDIDPSKFVTSESLTDFKRCKVLAQSEYDTLSSTEKYREDTLYFIIK